MFASYPLLSHRVICFSPKATVICWFTTSFNFEKWSRKCVCNWYSFSTFLAIIVWLQSDFFWNRRSYKSWQSKSVKDRHKTLIVSPRTGWIFWFIVNFEYVGQTDYGKDWQKVKLCRSYDWYKNTFFEKSVTIIVLVVNSFYCMYFYALITI